jgi:hypothetical protein
MSVPWLEGKRFTQLIPTSDNQLLLRPLQDTTRVIRWDQADQADYLEAEDAIIRTDHEGLPYFVERRADGRRAIRRLDGTRYGPAVSADYLFLDSTGGIVATEKQIYFLPKERAGCETEAACDTNLGALQWDAWTRLEAPGFEGPLVPSPFAHKNVAYTRDGAMYFVAEDLERQIHEVVRIEPGGTAASVPVRCANGPAKNGPSYFCGGGKEIIGGGPALDHVDLLGTTLGDFKLLRLENDTVTVVASSEDGSASPNDYPDWDDYSWWLDIVRGGDGQLYLLASLNQSGAVNRISVLKNGTWQPVADLYSWGIFAVTADGNIYLDPSWTNGPPALYKLD